MAAGAAGQVGERRMVSSEMQATDTRGNNFLIPAEAAATAAAWSIA